MNNFQPFYIFLSLLAVMCSAGRDSTKLANVSAEASGMYFLYETPDRQREIATLNIYESGLANVTGSLFEKLRLKCVQGIYWTPTEGAEFNLGCDGTQSTITFGYENKAKFTENAAPPQETKYLFFKRGLNAAGLSRATKFDDYLYFDITGPKCYQANNVDGLNLRISKLLTKKSDCEINQVNKDIDAYVLQCGADSWFYVQGSDLCDTLTREYDAKLRKENQNVSSKWKGNWTSAANGSNLILKRNGKRLTFYESDKPKQVLDATYDKRENLYYGRYYYGDAAGEIEFQLNIRFISDKSLIYWATMGTKSEFPSEIRYVRQ